MITDDIKNTYLDVKKRNCCDNKCKMPLGRIPKHVVLKGELLTKNMPQRPKICDCIVFQSDGRVCVSLAELKFTRITQHDMDDIREKFENAASCAVRILRETGWRATPTLIPILLVKSRDVSLVKYFESHPITLLDQPHYIQYEKCGSTLRAILDSLSDSAGR